VGSDSKELDGGIKMSCEIEGAGKMSVLEGIESGIVSATGDTETCAGETKSSEKDEVAGITETVGTSSAEAGRGAMETLVNIESKVWQPTTEESGPPCGQDVVEEKAGMTITNNASMRLFINVSPLVR
jgi:hypothetical protein